MGRQHRSQEGASRGVLQRQGLLRPARRPSRTRYRRHSADPHCPALSVCARRFQIADRKIQERHRNRVVPGGAAQSGRVAPHPALSVAPSAAAPEAGTKDNNPNDDKVKVNTEAMVGVGGLSPAQKEVIPMKALAFALGYLDNKQPNLDEMEAIVSSDMYIMDGHHRWAAATLVDPKKQVKVAKIEMPAVDLITALNVYTISGLAAGVANIATSFSSTVQTNDKAALQAIINNPKSLFSGLLMRTSLSFINMGIGFSVFNFIYVNLYNTHNSDKL